MTGRSSFRSLVNACLLVAAASTALAAGGADALVPFKDAAGAATEVSVAFVIDFGGSGAPLTGCVKVPSSDNGYYALSAFLTQEGEAQPIYNNAGLLCSINDIPGGAPEVCGQQTPQGYDFWSYWHGTTGTWQYASTGAFGTVTNGDVEGWRFQDPGPDNATAPAPRAAPDWSRICSSVVTTTTTTNTTTTTASAPPTTVVTPGTIAPGSSNDTVPPTGVDKPGTTTTQPSTSKGGSSPTNHSTKGSTKSTGSTRQTTSTTRAATTTSTRPPSTTSTTGGSQPQALAAAPVSGHGGGGGGSGSPVPFILGALIVLLLAAAATIGWRRRSGAV
jgi:hypothetical protein